MAVFVVDVFYVLLYLTRLAVWFFSTWRDRPKNSPSNLCWMTFDLWPFWRKNVDDENSHSNGPVESCSDVLLFSRDDISLEFLWSFSSWPAGKVNLKCHRPGIHQKNSPVHKNIHVHYPSTLVQHCTNVIQMFRVFWVAEFGYWCLSTSILASSSSRLSIWAATKDTHIKVSWRGGNTSC